MISNPPSGFRGGVWSRRWCPPGSLLEHALALAGRIATRSPRGLAEIKRVAGAVQDLAHLRGALAAELDALAGYVESADLREGPTAFGKGWASRFDDW
ncbi:hypothetical protein [Amycolatopsis methanolica]|uniref:Enoyl-CoA hydratase/isomerase family protein n=1 Tax=Amycolatopsis methanolica 239 TaxID=1068978 RepID=A0A076MXA4_AMYME|nr:hypothetical protein [Amycolatopsis methanolica]AIJ25564.1 enoyl-CoA hydratase/isomerase family protein [Amycolatopsis methanolica 239]